MIWTYLWQWHAGKLARELRSPWSQEWRNLVPDTKQNLAAIADC